MTFTSRNGFGYTPKAVIKPGMVHNKFYKKHISVQHDVYKEHEHHIKTLNKI